MSLGLAVIFPAVLLAIVAVMQAALVWHARNAALAAAHDGLDTARLDGGSPAAASRHATALLQRSTGDLLSGVRIGVTSTPTEVRVRVHASVLGVLPGLRIPVDAEASGPRERFDPDLGSAP